MKIVHSPYWPIAPDKVTALRGWAYMGPWCIKDSNGNWANEPVEVYYDPAPDTEKGHSNYPGFFFRGHTCYLTDAASAFSVPITGAVVGDEIIVSRFRHDFVSRPPTGDEPELGMIAIDGGRDYTKLVGWPRTVQLTAKGPYFYVGDEAILHEVQ